jgi:hypothetical protein
MATANFENAKPAFSVPPGKPLSSTSVLMAAAIMRAVG